MHELRDTGTEAGPERREHGRSKEREDAREARMEGWGQELRRK